MIYDKPVIQEREFDEIVNIILQHESRASRAVNEEILLTAWHVGEYISAKIKSAEWGSKVVSQLSEYIRSHYPEIRGYGRSRLYNMVAFYEGYDTKEFKSVLKTYLPLEIVHPKTGQFEDLATKNINQISSGSTPESSEQIVHPKTGQIPNVLYCTTLTNHIEILNRCRDPKERLFYILYSYKEKLTKRELDRCISNQTYSSLLGSKKNMSKVLLETYPSAPMMFKDKLFVDFLGIPQKHTEKKLRTGLIEHMKQFILELGKDFLFVDQEYTLEVGGSQFKADLLFFHRGLQALVAVELKKTKFHPRDLGQLEFYLEALDRDVKRTNENPSIGILLCPEADNIVVEYALNRSMSPTMVAEYKRALIPQEKMQQQFKEFCSSFLSDK